MFNSQACLNKSNVQKFSPVECEVIGLLHNEDGILQLLMLQESMDVVEETAQVFASIPEKNFTKLNHCLLPPVWHNNCQFTRGKACFWFPVSAQFYFGIFLLNLLHSSRCFKVNLDIASFCRYFLTEWQLLSI